MTFLVGQLETSPHLQLHLKWLEAVLYQHNAVLQSRSPAVVSALRAVQRTLGRKFDDLSRLCQFNRYTLQYALTLGGIHRKRAVEEASPPPSPSSMSSDEDQGDSSALVLGH